MLWAGVKVHRGKARVRELERGGHCEGAWASFPQRGIPQKRPLELHREGARERKREEESVVAQSAGRVDTAQTAMAPRWRWLGNQLGSYRVQPGLCQRCSRVLGWCSGAAAHHLGQPVLEWGQQGPVITHPHKLCHPHWAQSPGCSACCCGSGTRHRC